METKKINANTVSGIIITISAIGIMIVNYFTNGDLDSYIMPIIFFCMAVVMFTSNTKSKPKQIELSTTQKRVVLSIISIALVSGIVVFFITLF